ncbi:MAG: homoserine O-acetyltransferase [Elusimicrobiota bacterium]|jgi:homoserine O-acetyltransferase|nr:homoserine O-acetyltransferase [Elusimicrobiota bacterium]
MTLCGHQIFSFDNLCLTSKKTIQKVDIAYETWGRLDNQKSNAILITHAFSGDSHAAKNEGNKQDGWWEKMIGSGRAFDTDKYFIICSNVLGGCAGSTGPSSINPKSNKPYGLTFPVITLGDIVHAQKKLIDSLGIKKLLCVAGGSMGAMQSLQWAVMYPESIASAIVISAAMKHSPQQIAFNEVGRQSIMADPDWNDGNYYGSKEPEVGLAIARMIGHITYMSDKSMEQKFSRRLKENKFSFDFGGKPDFEVEGYLHYKGNSFVKRFDANSYLYITKAMDYFEVCAEDFCLQKNPKLKFLTIAFGSDWLYPPYQSQDIARQLKLKGYDASYCELKSTYGHDSFLLEIDIQAKLIKGFLNPLKK